MDAKLQAQVRSLTREVGALREAVRQEESKRERLAAHAKACDEARAAAEAKNKSLTYVNTKLEQEARSAREHGDAASAKSRAALQGLRARLADVERGVHQRSVEAVRRVQRLQATVQQVQAAAMPLAVAAAAAAGAAGPAQPPALKSPRLVPTAAAAQRAAAKPEQLHRGFAAVFAGLTQLAALFSGGGDDAEGNAVPLLLTAPDGSTRTVHWQDQNSHANSAGTASCAGGQAAGAVGAAAGSVEKQQLMAELARLRVALAEARQQAAAAATALPGQTAGGGRVEEAMRQLDAVVPQYRAAAQALQGQVAALRQQLSTAARERDALQAEVRKWRAAAQRHEAALAEATAKLHTREAQSLAATTQAESQAQGELGTLRQRCASLAGRLQEAQRTAVQLQGSFAAKERLAASQQQTIQKLEATIQEQQADIRAALALVSSRPVGATGAFVSTEPGGLPGCSSGGPWEDGLDDSEGGAAEAGALPCATGWDVALSAAEDESTAAAAASGRQWCPSADLPSAWDGVDASELAGGACAGAGQLEALLGAATAAADAATAWAGGCDGDAGQAAGWLDGDLDCLAGCWTIPAAPASPIRSLAAAAPVPAGAAPERQPRSRSGGSSQAVSLQGSPAPGGQLAVEADIAGLEQALRSALTDLAI